MFIFRGSLFSVSFVERRFWHHFNLRHPGLGARFADRPYPRFPLSPKTRRFQVKCPVLYAQTIKILTRHVHFLRASFLSPFRGEGVLTPLLGQVSRTTVSYESRAADLPTSPRIHPILKHLNFFVPGTRRFQVKWPVLYAQAIKIAARRVRVSRPTSKVCRVPNSFRNTNVYMGFRHV